MLTGLYSVKEKCPHCGAEVIRHYSHGGVICKTNSGTNFCPECGGALPQLDVFVSHTPFGGIIDIIKSKF